MNDFFAVLDIEHINLDPWTVLPPRSDEESPFEAWVDIAAWCREEAEDLWEEHGLAPDSHSVELLAGSLQRCAEAFSPPGSDHWLFLHHSTPSDLPLPVCAVIGQASGPREETLPALTLADDPQAVEPPVVKRFRSEHLGEGLSVFRYVAEDGSARLRACVRYAWRVEEYAADVVIWTASDDTARILRAAEDIEELARSLTIFDP